MTDMNPCEFCEAVGEEECEADCYCENCLDSHEQPCHCDGCVESRQDRAEAMMDLD